jgi:hypothetical protein
VNVCGVRVCVCVCVCVCGVISKTRSTHKTSNTSPSLPAMFLGDVMTSLSTAKHNNKHREKSVKALFPLALFLPFRPPPFLLSNQTVRGEPAVARGRRAARTGLDRQTCRAACQVDLEGDRLLSLALCHTVLAVADGIIDLPHLVAERELLLCPDQLRRRQQTHLDKVERPLTAVVR